MAVLQKIRDILSQKDDSEPFEPAPPTEYKIKVATLDRIDEIYKVHQKCFKREERYSKSIFNHLLSSPTAIGYCVFTSDDKIVGSIFVTLEENGVGHISTIGILPEHRRRGLAQRLLSHVEEMLKEKGLTIIRLEVRVSNIPAQNLYRKLGFAIVQRLAGYYSDGEDGFLMVKSL
ncbi:MAG: ribosomal-protein-alanine N-acetyltransferase [Acidobacteria bacterium]|jgi:ribosomal-protein-alanine N-acetyltransferase|nr:MAG: ribosomal-protein-alanine N-acetyltransferase [Acidobacteriota bacterium]GIU81479.1 MAG: ribosomal-protein-alanine N-acetyltransferase RimI [Pyrinomonadaceae bacterium]